MSGSVLVTGAGGFIGSHLRRLIQKSSAKETEGIAAHQRDIAHMLLALGTIGRLNDQRICILQYILIVIELWQRHLIEGEPRAGAIPEIEESRRTARAAAGLNPGSLRPLSLP